ncbi:hypothetical protein D1872_315400 [compost metagenome]
MERFQRIDLLAESGELNRAPRHRFDRQRRTAAGIPVQLGEHNPGQFQLRIEAFGDIYRILTGHRIDHEQHFIRLRDLVDLTELLHQRLVDMQPAGRID